MSRRTTTRSSFVALSLALTAFVPASARATSAPADEGMWLFSSPPSEALSARYGFEVTPAWLEHLQKSAVRVSTGGSGSIVSAQGLVMTNHHVASDILEKLSSADRNLLETGFYAATTEEELACPDLHLDVLWTITDVTARVEGAARGLDTAAAGAARRKAMTAIEDEAKKASGMHCEVVTLYQGGQYHLYQYKRFEDVRLVFAPEQQAAFFGGDNDNFEYPRHCLDVTFLRIYENGAPYQPEHFLKWSAEGCADGDLVFVAGHPGRTQRLNTLAHMEYLRDENVPSILGRLMRQEIWLQTYSAKSAEHARIAQGDLFSIQNSRKVYVGRLAGLLDPALFEAKRADEAALRAAIEANPEWKAQWGGAFDQIARAQVAAKELYPRFVALGGAQLALGAQTAAFASTLMRLADELEKPSGERLREFGDAALDQVRQALESPAPIYPEFDCMRLESALSLMAELLGADDEIVRAALAGKSPRARAAECVYGTQLGDLELRKRLAAGGAAALRDFNDPMLDLVRALDPYSREVRKRWEDEVQAVETEAYAKVAAARFAVHGTSVYPDATFTLRLAYGAVRGYTEGDTDLAPFTSLGGTYEKAAARAGEEAYTLPASWERARGELALDTPYNHVSTCDIIGGNSGSPVVDRKGEVVGLIFDGNIQSLVGNYGYSDDQARSISVDSRGIVTALGTVYGADRIVAELRK